MPPTAGWGCGIDRLTMLMCGVTNIREIILFPMFRSSVLKKDEKDNDSGEKSQKKKSKKRQHTVKEFDEADRFIKAFDELGV